MWAAFPRDHAKHGDEDQGTDADPKCLGCGAEVEQGEWEMDGAAPGVEAEVEYQAAALLGST